jgi:alanine dehydrogenase
VLLKGAKVPRLITKNMLKLGRPGFLMVDVAAD